MTVIFLTEFKSNGAYQIGVYRKKKQVLVVCKILVRKDQYQPQLLQIMFHGIILSDGIVNDDACAFDRQPF